MMMVSSCAYAELPDSFEVFQEQVAEKAKDPRQAAKLWFDAVFVYLTIDKELGKQMILEMSRYKDWGAPTNRRFIERLDTQSHIFFSYGKGSTPENGYTMDPNDYELVFHGETNLKPYADRDEGAFAKLFVVSGGADFPRSMTFQRNRNGEYKVYEFSSIYVGVRPPKAEGTGAAASGVAIDDDDF